MFTNRRLRAIGSVVALAALFGVTYLAPIPALGNASRERVISLVGERLPGWRVEGATDAWEGATAVTVACGSQQIGFQITPGHGLPAGMVWLEPADGSADRYLAEVSDYPGYLIWLDRPLLPRTLSCRELLARQSRSRGRAAGRVD
jgi:hypothetical protein